MGPREILSSRSGIEFVMGDVLRVLAVCMGALWLPELVAEVSGFRRTLGENIPNPKDVEKAVMKLRDLGYVTVREGIKATMGPKGEQTILIRLVRNPELIEALSEDDRLGRYMRIWDEVLRGFR